MYGLAEHPVGQKKDQCRLEKENGFTMTRRQQIWIEELKKQEKMEDFSYIEYFRVCEFVEWLASPEGVKFLNAAESRCEKEGV